MAENRELALSISINQRNPHHITKMQCGDLILGTDFRHAVEFSRSGRAKNPALRPSSSAACPTLRRARLAVTSGDLTAAPGPLGPVSLGAERKVRGRGGLAKPARGARRHTTR